MQSARNAAIIQGMYGSRERVYLSRCLADAFLAGTWTESELVARACGALSPRPHWLGQLAAAVLAAYHRPPADRPRELARFIELTLAGLTPADGQPENQEPAAPEGAKPADQEPGNQEPADQEPGNQEPADLRSADQQSTDQSWPTLTVRHWPVAEPAMGRMRWPVPMIPSTGELADFLELDHGQLAWFADARGLERTVVSERLRHYRYSARDRPGRTMRVIEQPKPRLKALQRRILSDVLNHIPVHGAAHGFTRGRSVRTHASLHTGAYVVMRLDLKDFFASIAAGRVYGIFRGAGYPESVAHALTAITTNVVPATFWHSLTRPNDPAQISAHHRLGRQLATPHLPQGSPTSPTLANLAAFQLDRRLSGLAAALGATYSRYADDLTFSGPRSFVGSAARFRQTVATIAAEEGFRVNHAKSTLGTRAGRQRVCGVVVNQHLNLARSDYDRLKAILHNARTQGPESQNRHAVADFRAHLLGRIAWVASLNPERGAKLHSEFDRITWL